MPGCRIRTSTTDSCPWLHARMRAVCCIYLSSWLIMVSSGPLSAHMSSTVAAWPRPLASCRAVLSWASTTLASPGSASSSSSNTPVWSHRAAACRAVSKLLAQPSSIPSTCTRRVEQIKRSKVLIQVKQFDVSHWDKRPLLCHTPVPREHRQLWREKTLEKQDECFRAHIVAGCSMRTQDAVLAGCCAMRRTQGAVLTGYYVNTQAACCLMGTMGHLWHQASSIRSSFRT
mmetsp:Transcript_22513/g.62189  ORF Transcript_22513/g.62189 Transcript_22513/m.62189 type:complete len:230 (-) Transcript_22513:1392-2081(-)